MTVRPRALGSMMLAAALSACGGNGAAPAVPPAPFLKLAPRSPSPISHVVFIVQENRSFNNLFLGFPGAVTQSYGYDKSGDKIALKPEALSSLWDIDHSALAFFTACRGQGTLPGTKCKMDGWDQEVVSAGAPANAPYAYVPRKQVAAYWALAKQYVLADDMFASNLDGSFVAHQYVVAAYADHSVDYPGTYWGCEGGTSDQIATLTRKRTYGHRIEACFDIPTIGTSADSDGLTWRFYAGSIDSSGGLWSSYQADSRVYDRRDWKRDVIDPPAQFLLDIRKGELANVTWVTPYYDASDHAGLEASKGPSWVASLVDAVGTSKFWKDSAIFVMWDDWGGWFDPVRPVYEDYDGLGFRVPLIVISPYAKQGYVTHVQYETASVLRYIEDNFGLPQLARADARANDPADDAFDYGQRPRAFVKIPGDKPPSYWMKLEGSAHIGRMPSHVIGDD
jgi:phospholipase C